MSATPDSDVMIARSVARELTVECERRLAAEGEPALINWLVDEAVAGFVAMGFHAEEARTELESEVAVHPDPVLRLKTRVLEQRIVERLGETDAVVAEMKLME